MEAQNGIQTILASIPEGEFEELRLTVASATLERGSAERE
jgi:hypothetical protein